MSKVLSGNDRGIDNFSVITNEEIEDVNLIKKIKKKIEEKH